MTRGRSSFALALAFSLVLFAGAWAYRDVLSYGHLGWDTWPMIASSRVTSPAEFFDTFREELMDGRYPIGRFYRPVANLSFALDYALWGTRAFGYHLTDLVLLGLSAALVLVLARRLGATPSGALLAAAVFVLHPIHVEALPVSARRADALAVLFTLAAVAAALGPARGRRTCIFLASLLAAGSKESGVVVAVLVPLAVAFVPHPSERGRRLASAAAALLGVGVFVAARTLVLGGLGGHHDSSLAGGLMRAPRILDAYATGLVSPQPWFRNLAWARPLSVALALVLAAALGLGALLRAGPADRAGTSRRALGLLAVWFVVVVGITAVSGEFQPWYGAPFLPVLALALGLVLDRGRALWRGGRRAPGALLVAAVALLLVSSLRFSALFHRYPVWEQADRDVKRFLAEVREKTAETPPGSWCEVRGMPLRYPLPAQEVGVTGAAGIAHYGVQAWADVELPERPITVVDVRELGRIALPGPDRILVIVYPARSPRSSGAEERP